MMNRNRKPEVSVVLAVHNGERFLHEAIDSVLCQTLPDFELLLVDDGSTDGTAQIIRSYSDPRLIAISNDRNLGHSTSLNLGVEAARSRVIARLDADDVCEPDRLRTQLRALEDRPALDVLGTWTTEIDEQGRTIGGFDLPASEGLIRWSMTRTNVVYHPTVMMRRSALEAVGGYDEYTLSANDHDLFTRMLMLGLRLDNLPRRLVRYRRSSEQMTQAKGQQQATNSLRARRRFIRWLLGEDVPVERIEAANRLQVAMGEPPGQDMDFDAIVDLVQRIRERCLSECDPVGRREINRRSRGAFLYHARLLQSAGRLREARRLWREAWRCGRTLTRDGRLWKQAVAIGRESVIDVAAGGETTARAECRS